MKTFVILTRRSNGAAEDLKRLAKPEVSHVWRGLADGIVRAVRGLADGPGAALDLESETFEQARRYIEALPYVEQNLLHVKYCAKAFLWLRETPVFVINELCMRCAVRASR